MEPEGSLPWSQEFARGPYPELRELLIPPSVIPIKRPREIV